MTIEQIKEIELFYQKLGIPKDVPVRTTLATHTVNGYFTTRSTVNKGKTIPNCNNQNLEE